MSLTELNTIDGKFSEKISYFQAVVQCFSAVFITDRNITYRRYNYPIIIAAVRYVSILTLLKSRLNLMSYGLVY